MYERYSCPQDGKLKGKGEHSPYFFEVFVALFLVQSINNQHADIISPFPVAFCSCVGKSQLIIWNQLGFSSLECVPNWNQKIFLFDSFVWYVFPSSPFFTLLFFSLFPYFFLNFLSQGSFMMKMLEAVLLGPENQSKKMFYSLDFLLTLLLECMAVSFFFFFFF